MCNVSVFMFLLSSLVTDESYIPLPNFRGYVFFLNGACISWTSKRQELIALSSTEAEFIASTEAAKKLCWILGFLQAIDRTEFNPRLLGDNKGALALTKDTLHSQRTMPTDLEQSIYMHVSGS